MAAFIPQAVENPQTGVSWADDKSERKSQLQFLVKPDAFLI
jgi:hypothetical protein